MNAPSSVNHGSSNHLATASRNAASVSAYMHLKPRAGHADSAFGPGIVALQTVGPSTPCFSMTML